MKKIVFNERVVQMKRFRRLCRLLKQEYRHTNIKIRRRKFSVKNGCLITLEGEGFVVQVNSLLSEKIAILTLLDEFPQIPCWDSKDRSSKLWRLHSGRIWLIYRTMI